MLEQIIASVPEKWRELFEILLAPIVWIPRLQRLMLDFFLDSSSGWIVAGKYVFLLFPVLLWIAAVWCTQLSLYTLPFRARRSAFISTMLLTWWDAVRAVWLYWVGIFRLVAVVAGWAFTLGALALKLTMEAFRQVVLMPFRMTGKMTESYFQPGVPWVAFLMLLFWCVLEAAIFTYTLFPTVTEVLADLAGADEGAPFARPILYLFLLLLIMGSFACIQALLDAIKNREFKFLVQIVVVELFVMFFEVMFLYRELVDAITPWIAQQTGDKFRMGIGGTLTLATFGWMGVRGMTWFLFGRFGTPPLLAFISRRPMVEQEGLRGGTTAPEPEESWWRAPLADFKREIGWLHERSDELLEYLALPVLQVLAGALNFAMVLLASRPVFSLPFKGLKAVMMETGEALAGMSAPKKGASL